MRHSKTKLFTYWKTLRLSHRQSVKHEDDLPVREDIFDKMIQWYGHLVETGDI